MATATQRQSAATVSGYFRDLFEKNPAFLKEPNKDILGRWELDHPGKNATASIKTALAKAKAKFRGSAAARQRGTEETAARTVGGQEFNGQRRRTKPQPNGSAGHG